MTIIVNINCLIAISLLCYTSNGWKVPSLEDPLQFAPIRFLFLGKSTYSRWKEQSPRDEDLALYYSEGVFSFIFVLIACSIMAVFRKDDKYIEKHKLDDRDDMNGCFNYGGCKSGPEELPEATLHSVLFSTRLYLDSIKQGVKIEINEKITKYDAGYKNYEIKIPHSMSNIWKYTSEAIEFRYSNVDMKFNDIKDVPEGITIKIDSSTIHFEQTCKNVTIEQTNFEINAEKISDCSENIRQFEMYGIEKMMIALELARKNKYILKNKHGY